LRLWLTGTTQYEAGREKFAAARWFIGKKRKFVKMRLASWEPFASGGRLRLKTAGHERSNSKYNIEFAANV